MKPWERFLEKYAAFGMAPSVERYVDLFDADATLLHPGMKSPIGRDQVAQFIERALKRLPAFRFMPIHWNFSGDTIFVEARNSAEVNGKPIAWPSIYRIVLREDRVLHGRAFCDRAEVLAHLDPSRASGGVNAHSRLLDGAMPGGASGSDRDVSAELHDRFVKPYAENWKNPDPARFVDFYRPQARMINPGFERPLGTAELPQYYRSLIADTPGLSLRLERWAGSPNLLFCEWTATGRIGGRQMTLSLVDRFTLDGFQAVEGVAYFDRLELLAMADPEAARTGDVSDSSAAPPR